MIEERDDIFWLTQDEVEQAASRLDRGDDLHQLSTAVLQRKADLARRQAGQPTPGAASRSGSWG